MLSEAKKRKISTRGEDLQLQLLAEAEDLTAAVGEKPTATSRERDFSISAVTYCNERRVCYSGRLPQRATRSLKRVKEKPSPVRVILGRISRPIIKIKMGRRIEVCIQGSRRFHSTEVWDQRKETTEYLDRSIMCTLVFFLFPSLNTS